MIDPIRHADADSQRQRALLPDVEMPHSRMKESIAGILKKEGYVADVAVEGKMPQDASSSS